MRRYLIKIIMHDGAMGTLRGLFSTDWDAIDAAMAAFHNARAITPRRLP